MAYKRVAVILNSPNGSGIIENDMSDRLHFRDIDDCGAKLEQILWPLLAQPLREGKSLNIYVTDEKL